MQQYIAHLSKLTARSGLLILAACGLPQPQAPSPALSSPPELPADRPADAPAGTCWDSTVTPAVIQTTTERILIEPADISPEGTIRAPAQYRNQDRQIIAKPRETVWYEVVCKAIMTPEFLSSLQRALRVRGHHQGAITGQLDIPTQDAIARYQTQQDLPGYELTVEGAQRLGLITTEPRS